MRNAYFCCSFIKSMSNKFLLLFLLILFFSCDNNSNTNPDFDKSVPLVLPNNIAAPQPIIYTVKNVYPHDPSAFTQGLEFHNGKLYEGTGEYGKSRLRIVDIKSGIAEKEQLLSDKSIFGEGITLFLRFKS